MFHSHHHGKFIAKQLHFQGMNYAAIIQRLSNWDFAGQGLEEPSRLVPLFKVEVYISK